MADITRRLFLRQLRGTADDAHHPSGRRPGPASGHGADLLVPPDNRGPLRGPSRRSRAPAALPRPHQRLSGHHCSSHGHLPDHPPGHRRHQARLQHRPDQRRLARRPARPARRIARRTGSAARPRPARRHAARPGGHGRGDAGPRADYRGAVHRCPARRDRRADRRRPGGRDPAGAGAGAGPADADQGGGQTDADRATYERRTLAVERERAIAENELQNKIELARREEQLVAQDGANARRQAEESAAADRVRAEYVGDAGHQSARYLLRTAEGQTERHSSSELIVGTGTGATGWCASIARDRDAIDTLPAPQDRHLCWFAREAWPSPATGTSLTSGLLTGGDRLELTSEGDRLVIFADGIEHDHLTLSWGQRVTVGTARQHLRLVR